MTKNILFFILFLTSSLNSFEQIYSRTQLDRLRSSLPEKEGKDRIHGLLELSEAYYQFELDTAVFYAEKAGIISATNGYEWGIYKSLYCWANTKFLNSHQRIVEPVAKLTADWFNKNGYQKDAIYSELLLAKCMKNTDGMAKALEISKKALTKSQEIQHDRLTGLSWLRIHAYNDGSFSNVIDSALYFFERCSDSFLIFKTEQIKFSLNKNSDLGKKASRKWLSLGIQMENMALKQQALVFLCFWNSDVGDVDSTLYYYNECNLLVQSYPNIRLIMKAQREVAHSTHMKDIELGITYLEESLKTADHLGAKKYKLKLLFELVQKYTARGNYKKAVNIAINTIDLAKELNDELGEHKMKVSLAQLYLVSKEYDKAIEIIKENEIWIETLSDTLEQQSLHFGNYVLLSLVYCETKEFELALFHAKKCLKNAKNFKPNYKIVPEVTILKIYVELKNRTAATRQYEKILKSFDKDFLATSGFFQIVKGRYMVLIGKYEEGIEAINTHLNRSHATRIHINNLIAYDELHKAYKGLGDFKSALEAHEIYKEINDSIQLNTIKESIIEIKSQAEISKKEAEILDLQKQQEIQDLKLVQQESDLKLRKSYNLALSIGFLFILALAYGFFRRYRLKKEKEKAEMRVRRIELELEHSNAIQKAELAEVKNTLFANVSHEFRTPLTLIKVPIEEYIKRVNKEDQPIFDRVLYNTDQLLEMVDELLDLEKMESDSFELRSSKFELTNFFTQVKTNYSAILNAKQIKLLIKNDLSNISFEGDENRLLIVLNNLIKNAYNHTNDGGLVQCKLEMIDVSAQQGLHLLISNTGKNILEKDLPNIFNRYYRGNQESYIGTGIGLALSKQIIELHNGTISVDNSVNNEVTFHVRIPGKLIVSTTKSLTEKQINADSNKTNAQDVFENDDHPKVLIVEDNKEVMELLDSILNPAFQLIFAENGEIGENLALEKQPDLILSDVMMPKKDGFELLTAIKTNIETSHIPVILLTAKADLESKISGLNLDADDYISKPFNRETLVARIQNLIRQRQQLQKVFTENPALLRINRFHITGLDQQFINKLRKVMESNYTDADFSVNKLSRELALNRNSVHNKIKAFTNQSTALYIKHFRLNKASKMLLETNLSVSAISFDSGFKSPQVFSKLFKERFELTPLTYRKENRVK